MGGRLVIFMFFFFYRSIFSLSFFDIFNDDDLQHCSSFHSMLVSYSFADYTSFSPFMFYMRYNICHIFQYKNHVRMPSGAYHSHHARELELPYKKY